MSESEPAKFNSIFDQLLLFLRFLLEERSSNGHHGNARHVQEHQTGRQDDAGVDRAVGDDDDDVKASNSVLVSLVLTARA